MSEQELQNRVAKDLRRAGFQVEQRPKMTGVRPDLMARAPDGREFAVGVKQWDNRPGFAARAANYAKHYERTLGVDGGFVVLDGLKRNYGDGVVTPEGLVSAMEDKIETSRPRKPKSHKRERTNDQIFAAMPFRKEYDDVYLIAMQDAAKSVKAACKRVDRESFTGSINDEIRSMIRASRIVVADVSESPPNVLYEMGLAEGMRKPVLQISSTRPDDLPFDIRQNQTVRYSRTAIHALREKLKTEFRALLKGSR